MAAWLCVAVMGGSVTCARARAEAREPDRQRLMLASGTKLPAAEPDPAASPPQEMLHILRSYDQLHLLDHYRTLSPAEQQLLLADLSQVNFILQDFLSFHHLARPAAPARSSLRKPVVGPKSFSALARFPQYATVYEHGKELIAAGKTCVLTIVETDFSSPESRCAALNALQELVGRVARRAWEAGAPQIPGAELPITLFVLTTRENDQPIKDFLAERNFLGYHPMYVFPQDDVVAIDARGKMLLRSPTALLRRSMGSGGAFKSIRDYNLAEHLRTRGHQLIHFIDLAGAATDVLHPFIVAEMEGQTRAVANRYAHAAGAFRFESAETAGQSVIVAVEDGEVHLPVDTYVPAEFFLRDELFLSLYNPAQNAQKCPLGAAGELFFRLDLLDLLTYCDALFFYERAKA